MKRTLLLIAIGLALMLLFFRSVEKENRGPDADQRADAETLLENVRNVLPEGWEATLYWDSEDIEKGPVQYPVDWIDDQWRRWLPGMDGRRIEIRRTEVIRYHVDAPNPNPQAQGSYFRIEEDYLRFALTLGSFQQAEEINERLLELDNRIKPLETVLKPSLYRQEKDGYNRYSVPRDDKGQRALDEHDILWAIKRRFPQWSEGSLSVGFGKLIWLRKPPDEAKVEYRQTKAKVLDVLHPIQGWKYISADDE